MGSCLCIKRSSVLAVCLPFAEAMGALHGLTLWGWRFGDPCNILWHLRVGSPDTRDVSRLLQAIQVMREQKSCGHIFNMDGAGADGNATPLFSAYGATKRGLAQLGKSLQVGFAHRQACLTRPEPLQGWTATVIAVDRLKGLLLT